MRLWSGVVALLALLVLAGACAEPAIDVDIPERDGQVADLADILDDDALESVLAGYAAEGVDIVVLTYETPVANCGEAFRAGQEFVAAWQADVALVGVALPGDFGNADGERCVGLQPLDDFDVSRSTREEVSEVLWPPLIADNAWDRVFTLGADEVFAAMSGTTGSEVDE